MRKNIGKRKEKNRSTLTGPALLVSALCVGACLPFLSGAPRHRARPVSLACASGNKGDLVVEIDADKGVNQVQGRCPNRGRYLLGGRININAATEAELELLPGIGTRSACAVIEHREKTGGFENRAEFELIPGLTGPARTSLDLWADVK
jgi:competence protein ComEA